MRSAVLRTALLFLRVNRPSLCRYSPLICMALKTMLSSMDWSRSRPTPLRSSDTMAMPARRASPALPSLSSSPNRVTLPRVSYRLITPLGMPSLPCPASPPIPRISPSYTSRDTPRTSSPGISTCRSRMLMATLSCGGVRGAACTMLSPLRPIISSASSTTLVCSFSRVAASLPSRSIVIESAAAITSSRRWVIKMMAMPFAAIFFITETSCVASLSVSTAVGSSNTSSFTPVLSISRAISTNCI